ncbi:DUF2063 domain-containing protein [Shewanella intestini]|uniref:DUF2063 domain-containing protein n=1 Tax=Shewanella intestini TaxID=2017544 RepID=A0ABS5I4L1_9GAMM|nr:MULTISPECIES: putative DNA-binding domain-containing protein [Shewanella]MBR9728963.1 DUF2063 domain-containing protein [Shewanella intestini]MRG36971.1 DUF2063 domain-containing protein [Shewanella sp. XMDDZSB0408]
MDFIKHQQQFMAYIKNPQSALPSGIEPRRMHIYRELFFNNIDGFVSSAFPVLKSLYSAENWQQLIQQFFVTHQCKTPIFIEIAAEFLQFLQNEHQVSAADPVFLLELAHYEWLELVVSTAQPLKSEQLLTADSVLTESLTLAATAKIAQYSFDVQHISVDYQPIAPTSQPQFFCVYLDKSEEVAFLQLNPLTAQVLAFIESKQHQGDFITVEQLLDWLTTTYPQMSPELLQQGCESLLITLASQGILVTWQDKL